MRMKPRRATWVETRKTRPFWTLSTIRRPSRRPYISVANESSPSTRSDASRATAVPLPMATATSARVERRRVVDAVAGDRDDPAVRAGDAGRAAPCCSGVDRATIVQAAAARRASSRRPSRRSPSRRRPRPLRGRPAARSPPRSSGGRRSRRSIWIPARGPSPSPPRTPSGAGRRSRSARASGRPAPSSTRRASATSRSPVGSAASIRASPRGQLVGRDPLARRARPPAHRGESVSTRPSPARRGRRERPGVGRRRSASTSSAGSRRGSAAAPATASHRARA